MVRTYIKLYGPPIFKAIKALEKISIDMPEVCVMNPIMQTSGGPAYYEPVAPVIDREQATFDYFWPIGPISKERCSKIISKSGEKLGEYDFFFEWFKDPTMEQLNNLIQKIDETLTPLGVRYTITTKR